MISKKKDAVAVCVVNTRHLYILLATVSSLFYDMLYVQMQPINNLNFMLC